MKYILYTTSTSNVVQPLVDVWAKEISKTKGRGEVIVTVVRKIPKNVERELDADKHWKFPWGWFATTFPRGEYDGVIFHFTPYYRRKWKLTESINGSRNTHNTVYPEFWVCASPTAWAKGYENVLEIHRILYHEQAHYDEDVDDAVGNVLTQDSVHTVDYILKQIDKYHLLVDYRGQALKHAVNKALVAVIKFAKKYI